MVVASKNLTIDPSCGSEYVRHLWSFNGPLWIAHSNLAAGSIVIGCLVLALKYVAYRLTGSEALYFDARESTINVATAISAFIAVRLSATPPDANHSYGHHKAEYLFAVGAGRPG
jgi:divalent metal cation (Fe/Co/Zn/Cd) transporter